MSSFILMDKDKIRMILSNGSPIKFFTYQEAMAYCEKAKERGKQYAPVKNLIPK